MNTSGSCKTSKMLGGVPRLMLISLLLDCCENSPPPTGLRDLSDLVPLVTQVSPVKTMYISYDVLAVNHPLPLIQIEATIDALSTKLSSLRYATTLENLQPLNVVSRDVVLTLFQTILPLTTSLQACRNLELQPLSLDNLPLALKTSKPILLHYEISVGTNSLFCVSPSYTLKEDECLDDIQVRLANFLPSQPREQLLDYLLTHFVGTVAHITVYSDRAEFTNSPFGNSACIGSYNPEKLDKQAAPDVKLLHEHFYEKLNDVYTDIYDYLDVIVSHLADTVHSLSSETYTHPVPYASLDDKVSRIVELMPTFLPNFATRAPTYPNFDEFFISSIGKCPDFLLRNITAASIKTMPERQMNILLSSLMQFEISLKGRLSEYMKTFNMYQADWNLPMTVLFTANQNPNTFLYLIRSILPGSDENLLVEIFIMLQNEKASLLQNIAFLFSKDVKVSHLTRSEFSSIVRRQWKIPSDSQRKDQPDDVEKRPLAFIHNFEKLPNLVLTKDDTAPFVKGEAELHLTNGTFAGAVLNMLIPGSGRRRLRRHRQKRSWGSFWGATLGVASQDQLDDIYKHELEIGNSELAISTTLRNITDSNSHLLNAVQTVTASVNSVLAKEENLFADLHQVMNKEELTLEKFSRIFTTLDRSTSLISEYLTLQTQTALLFSSVQKLQSLVLSVVTDTLDVSQIPTSILRPLLTSNPKLSIASVKAKFVYTQEGYQIEFLLPKLTQPYTVYFIQSLPFYWKGLWLSLDIQKFFVMNSIHETADWADIESVCSLRADNYLCPSDMVHVKQASQANSCAYQVVLSKTTGSAVAPNSCLTIKFGDMDTQKYLSSKNDLVISSPKADVVHYNCADKSQNRRVNISVGISHLTTVPGCSYETSDLQIRGAVTTTVISSDDDIGRGLAIANSINGINTLLEGEAVPGTNFTVLKSLLTKYGAELERTDKTAEQLSREISQLDEIRTISDFSPTKLDLSRPWHSGNWLAFMFWCLCIFAILLTCSMIRNFSWYIKRVKPVLGRLASFFAYCISGLAGCMARCLSQAQLEETDDWITDLPEKSLRIRAANSFASIYHAVRGAPSAHSSENVHSEEREIFSLSENDEENPFCPTVDYLEELERNPKSQDWSPTRSLHDNWQIRRIILSSSGRIIPMYYDPISGKITDKNGIQLRNIEPPSETVLSLFDQIVANSVVPKIIKEDDGTWRHKEFQNLHFDQTRALWKNSRNNSYVAGIPPPISEILRHVVPSVAPSDVRESSC